MNIEEAKAVRDQERNHRAEIAGSKMADMQLPTTIETPEEILGLGDKTAKFYVKTREELLREFGQELPKIVGVALHEYWFACWDGAAFFQLNIDERSFNDNTYTRRLATPEGYADMHGWANTLANGFADIVPTEGRKKWIKRTTGHEILEISTALRCMALFWLHQASIEMEQGNAEFAVDLIHEAHDALAIHLSNLTWDDAWNDATKNAEESVLPKNPDSKLTSIDQEVARRISDKARKAALASHRENHQLKADVFDWCEANRNKGQSRSEAARIISGGLMPIKYPTAYGYITDWDKLHPERVQ
jgi:hypothetical protein